MMLFCNIHAKLPDEFTFSDEKSFVISKTASSKHIMSLWIMTEITYKRMNTGEADLNDGEIVMREN